MKRSDLLKLGDDALKAIKLPFQLRKEKKSIESWILDYEEKVATLDAEIVEIKAEEKLNVDSILDKIDDKDLAERRLKQGEDLMRELFD